MGSTQTAYHDLCAIKGIGPARQRWLRNSFNARTYQDLAGLSVDQIESQLKADGQIVSRAAIETWLAEAQTLAGQTASASASEPDLADEPASQPMNSIARKDGWEPVASFVIEYQVRGEKGQTQETRTAIHHIESDTDTHWTGIESSQVCRWMVDQLPALIREQSQKPRTQETKAAIKPAAEKLKITQIRVLQPPQTAEPALRIEAGKAFTGALDSDHPFTLEVDFGLNVAAAASRAKHRIECSARSFAYDTSRQANIPLGETGLVALDKGQSTCTLTLPQATLQRGTYRLWVLVNPQESKYVHPDYVEVPDFQVN